MINYHNRKFKSLSNSENGELGDDTVFYYKQKGRVITCEYRGGKVETGHLIGIVDDKGSIEIAYHQVNTLGEIRTGICLSTPELLPDGKLKIHEKWRWTNGDLSSGTSTLLEI